MNTNQLIQKISGGQIGPTAEKWIAEHLELARAILADLAKVNSNTAFHLWREQAIARLRERTSQLNDTWIALAISVAYEQYKARAEFFLWRWLRALWGGITRAGLDGFLKNHGASLLRDALEILTSLLGARTNETVRQIRDLAWQKLHDQYNFAKDNWIALILDAAFAVLRSRGLSI
jgi:hypothetical protein